MCCLPFGSRSLARLSFFGPAGGFVRGSVVMVLLIPLMVIAMIDGLTIWLALVGVATIVMYLFDGLAWAWRKIKRATQTVTVSSDVVSREAGSDA